ncbi:hypothetical protein AB1N83_005945 [Pleurotus pulmonarius]
MDFLQSFICCCAARKKSKDAIDETSRLLPPLEDIPSPQISDVVVVDHQKLRDKLTTIVRSKEGKMVNVNAALPFNLHNQVLPHQGSYSRSRSISAERYQNQYDGPSYAHSNANGALAPSPLRRTIDLPHSPSTDLRDGVDAGGQVLDPAKHRAALLGLKLVHVDGQGGVGGSEEIDGGRGRLGWTPEVEEDSTPTSKAQTSDVATPFNFPVIGINTS